MWCSDAGCLFQVALGRKDLNYVDQLFKKKVPKVTAAQAAGLTLEHVSFAGEEWGEVPRSSGEGNSLGC